MCKAPDLSIKNLTKSVLDFKMDPYDILGRRRARKKSAKASEARAAELAAEEERIKESEETKRRQRKATATILTSGQGLGVDQGGNTLGQ